MYKITFSVKKAPNWKTFLVVKKGNRFFPKKQQTNSLNWLLLVTNKQTYTTVNNIFTEGKILELLNETLYIAKYNSWTCSYRYRHNADISHGNQESTLTTQIHHFIRNRASSLIPYLNFLSSFLWPARALLFWHAEQSLSYTLSLPRSFQQGQLAPPLTFWNHLL